MRKSLLEFLKTVDYFLGADYVRQHPIGDQYVADFAFTDEKIVVEIDGSSHRNKNQIKKDVKRDWDMKRLGWDVIRIYDRDFRRNPTFYKHLIKETVESKRIKIGKVINT